MIKNLRSVYAIALGIVVLATSCKKNPEDPITGGTQDPSFKKVNAKVDGSSFQSKEAAALKGNSESFVLTATDANNNGIMITAPAREGDYNSADNELTSGTYTGPDGTVWMSTFDGSATVKVTKYNASTKKISGTFSFTAGPISTSNATGTKTITEGTFTDITVL